MNYSDLVAAMKRYGATERDICAFGLGAEPEQIRENVVISPVWEPPSMPALGEADLLSDMGLIKLWNLESAGVKITYISTGIGAPVLMDALLTLGLTPCKKVIFIGSVGALDENMGIGDIVVPESSVCGDGASRYILSGDLGQDVFGSTAYPDPGLYAKIRTATERICGAQDVRWHVGRTFSIDTIFAEFAHLENIIGRGCNVIEMETAAAFAAGKLMNIPVAALFSVSDNSVASKSLMSGRTEDDREYRRFTRREVLPEIVLSSLRE